MAYDEDVSHRVRALLSSQSAVQEKRMLGGLAFLVEGNMAITASGRGGVLVRVGPAQSERLVARSHAEPAIMGGPGDEGLATPP